MVTPYLGVHISLWWERTDNLYLRVYLTAQSAYLRVRARLHVRNGNAF
jgi:hypothetical protein